VEPPAEHRPILTRGDGFLYKDETAIILLPAWMKGRTARVVFAWDPAGKSVFLTLPETSDYNGRPRFRWAALKDKLDGVSFYAVVFFKTGGLPQPYLILDGGKRQE
jgi:hypothetical protein